MSIDVQAFSGRLREAMVGHSVRSIARGAGIGESSLREYLAGKAEPSIGATVAIAGATGVSVEWLATGAGEKPPGVRGQRGQDMYLSAADLAGLPGMPGTERGVRKRALREGWPGRPRCAQGGGFEYPVASLPYATQVALNASLTARSPRLDQSIAEVMMVAKGIAALLRLINRDLDPSGGERG